MNTKNACFVISPIGESDSDTRKRADQILRHVIKPAVEQCGYIATRADEIDQPGIITSQVIQRVVEDPLVVADLTERNPNVFYELAIRHALRKPLVQIIKKGEQIPFDVAATRTVQVNHQDLDSVETAKQEIVSQIHSLEADPSALETPISVSLDLQLLRQSEKPEKRSLADLVSSVVNLRSDIAKINARFGDGEQENILDEIKGMLRILPRHIEKRWDRSLYARRNVAPSALRGLMLELFESREPQMATLVVASAFRESLPWIYELGVNAYQALRKNSPDVEERLREFTKAINFAVQSPIAENLVSKEETRMLVEALRLLGDFRA